MAGIGFGLSPLISRQGWWEDNWPGASMAIDFTQDKAMVLGREKVISDVLSITRASTKWIADSTGLIKPVTANTLAYNDLGLDVEESRTNLLAYSDDFTQWGAPEYATLTANAAEAPDGSTTATKVTENTDTNNHGIHYQYIVPDADKKYVLTVFAKVGAGPHGTHLDLHFWNNIEGSNSAVFDLVNGTISGPRAADATIEEAGNGWWRCSLTGTANGTNILYFRIQNSDGANKVYAGDGTSYIYLWRAQLEEGSFPTSPIQTSGSAVTRAADDVLFSDLTWAANEGTWLVESAPGASWVDSVNYILSEYTSTSIHNLWLYNNYAEDLINSYDGTTRLKHGSVTSQYKIAFAQSSTEMRSSLNGGVIKSASVMLPKPTQLHVGSYRGLYYFANSKIKKLVFFPSIKSDSELQALTS